MNMEKPICPKCHSKVNVVRIAVGFRCAYCDIKFNDIETGSQQKLL